MASNTKSQGQLTQGKRVSITGYHGANASILLEKAKSGIRRSTPDSEALASSDDEQDQHHQLHSSMTQPPPRPTRRPSWLNEFQQAPSQRKGSLSGSGTFSPTNSHPATPITDQPTWPSSVGASAGPVQGRGHSSSASFPWGNAIWNSDPQKGPPSRLTEVLPSPGMMASTGSASFYGDESLVSPSTGRDNIAESSIPFAIPLHPTPKTYRSQSYSVGQLDPESTSSHTANSSGYIFSGRNRTGSSYAGLQHRHSRPSVLGDLSHDPSILGQVREVEDDEESSNSSEAGVRLSNTQARTIEQLAMENALLRQAAASQAENERMRNLPANIDTASLAIASRFRNQSSQKQADEALVEESGYDLEGLGDLGKDHMYNQGMTARRFSEYAANLGSQVSNVGIPENRKLESVKKGHWQSSLGFGGLVEPPQSRRHSFADVPTRHGSISSSGEQNGSVGQVEGTSMVGDQGGSSGYSDRLPRQSQGDTGEYAYFHSRRRLEEKALELENLRNRNFAASYFSKLDPSLRSSELYASSKSSSSLHQVYNMQNPYSRQQQFGHSQPRHNQLLYVVTFKACRADVFFVQEGTGLQVKAGDLVIVEADRGTDLGTVAQENITWALAKELKEHYVEEHYKWLMMFSRHGQNGSTPAANPNAQSMPSNGSHTGSAGGTGLQGQSNGQEIPNSELKPKIIKRLAQAHEIQTLHDKEANEAKAKRVCQQKVAEHRLNMEILDAEFQMDWKKLTFYYFADSYINFNTLVTDLFKIYKTRIWMSAINPASFVTPTSGLQMPLGLGPGAMIPDNEGFSTRHMQKENAPYSSSGLSEGQPRMFDQAWASSRDLNTQNAAFPNPYLQAYRSHALESRQLNPSLPEFSGIMQQSVGVPSQYTSRGAMAQNHHRSSYANDPPHANRKGPSFEANWPNVFQGLSLNS